MVGQLATSTPRLSILNPANPIVLLNKTLFDDITLLFAPSRKGLSAKLISYSQGMNRVETLQHSPRGAGSCFTFGLELGVSIFSHSILDENRQSVDHNSKLGQALGVLCALRFDRLRCHDGTQNGSLFPKKCYDESFAMEKGAY